MIVLVDDEKREMDTYLRELRLSGYEVEFYQDVDSALEFIKDNTEQVDVVIMDVMMPAGAAFEDIDTQEGLRTGIYFFETIREVSPNLPFIVLTNVSNAREAERFSSQTSCWFLRKENYRPFEFVEELATILSTLRQA